MRTDLVIMALVATLVVTTGLLAACGGPAPTETTEPPQEAQPTAPPTTPPQEEQPPPAGHGAALLEERCTACHTLGRVTQAQKTREEWGQTVTRMVGKGAQLSEDEQNALTEYLAETYGP